MFSEELFEELIKLIEGDVINFQEKRRDKILDRNAHKLAELARNGELDGLKFTATGEVIGDPVARNKYKEIEDESKEVIKRALPKTAFESCYQEIATIVGCILEETSYLDKEGYTQMQLVPTNLTGRNLQQEAQAAKEAKRAQANKPKNPNRVAGGKKAQETKKQNQKQEFAQRPLFQAMNYNPNQEGDK